MTDRQILTLIIAGLLLIAMGIGFLTQCRGKEARGYMLGIAMLGLVAVFVGIGGWFLS
jgi:hypothetical protein